MCRKERRGSGSDEGQERLRSVIKTDEGELCIYMLNQESVHSEWIRRGVLRCWRRSVDLQIEESGTCLDFRVEERCAGSLGTDRSS